MELIAELASAHGGDLSLAKHMIDIAVRAGAHTIKTQAYAPESVYAQDPQAEWLVKSALGYEGHLALKAHAEQQGADYFASVFDSAALAMIAKMCGRVKIASTEAEAGWWHGHFVDAVVSFPWSAKPPWAHHRRLVTVPMYPTPTEVLCRVDIAGSDGWSDHCIGTHAARYFAAKGAEIIEVHVAPPNGEGRGAMPWDKSFNEIRAIREWMDECAVMRTGVSRKFAERWVR